MIKNLFTAGLSIDKWAHFLVGTICGLTITFFTTNMVLGICAAIAIGVLKEWIIDGWIKRLVYFPKRLSDAELVEMTV